MPEKSLAEITEYHFGETRQAFLNPKHFKCHCEEELKVEVFATRMKIHFAKNYNEVNRELFFGVFNPYELKAPESIP